MPGRFTPIFASWRELKCCKLDLFIVGVGEYLEELKIIQDIKSTAN